MKRITEKSSKPARSRVVDRAKVVQSPRAIRTILIPTDFSPLSLKALSYGSALAKKLRAMVHLIHVNDVQFEQPLLAPYLAAGTELGQKIRRRLQLSGAQCAIRVPSARCHVREGKAYDRICREAQRIAADLIVIATHGYTGLKHVLLGSTAERVVRHAPCPVLVVHQKERHSVGDSKGRASREKPLIQLAKILVPTDFSPDSREALATAITLAKRFGAKLTLLHCIYPHYYATNPDYTVYDLPSLEQSLRENAEKEMQDLVQQTAFSRVPLTAQVIEGYPSHSILEFATDTGADLIVTATHGTTGLKHVLIGSTAEQIVRNARCPVLVIPRRRSRKSG